jgi:ribonuclease-3
MFFLQESLSSIEERLSYRFQDRSILTQAFIHRSFLNECQLQNLIANERLEFLGDAVLNLYVSAFVFERFPDDGEGHLSKQKAQAVCQASCAVMMEHLGLIDHLLVGKGEQTLLAKSRPSLGSDLFEAIVGAIYVDGGWHAAEKFLSSHFDAHFSSTFDANASNAKAELQELLAKQGKGLPRYSLKEMSGPPHDRLFCVAVLVEGQEMGVATGKTKREAEQRAATVALGTLKHL